MKWLIPIVICAAGLAAQPKEPGMHPRLVDEAGFVVVGVEARTTNAREMTPDGIIGRQWQRFMAENLLAQIPNRADSSILAVYTDYASDKEGEYTYVLGARVNATKDVPPGMVAKKIPAGQYAIFTSEKGAVEKVVPSIWEKINSLPKSAPGGDRAYQADYEVYDERAANPRQAQVDVHVGIRH
jgi:predicted transcriptional regulator YdeE